MTCACGVDEVATKVGHNLSVVIHAHASAVGYVCHVTDLKVLLSAIALEFLFILSLYHHRHTLLRFGDGKLSGV